MARSLEQVYYAMLMNQVQQTAQLTAALEAAQERIAKLEADAKAKEPAPEGA